MVHNQPLVSSLAAASAAAQAKALAAASRAPPARRRQSKSSAAVAEVHSGISRTLQRACLRPHAAATRLTTVRTL